MKAAVDVLDRKRTELFDIAGEYIVEERLGLRKNAQVLQEQVRAFLQSHKDGHVRLSQRLLQLPLRVCADSRNVLALRAEALRRSSALRSRSGHVKIDALDKLVRMASPVRVLKRGFSITRLASGKLVRSSDDVSPADELVTELTDSKITSIVK